MATKTTTPMVTKRGVTSISSTTKGRASKSSAERSTTQNAPIKTTSTFVVTKVPKTLRENRASSVTKSAAGAVLPQTPVNKSSGASNTHRIVRPAAKAGSITRAAARSAVMSVISAKKKMRTM
jgi:hypothetical protein